MHQTPHSQSQSRLIEHNLLDNLTARVSLTALVTLRTRWLLVSPALTLVGILFCILAVLIDTVPEPEKISYAAEAFLITLIQTETLFFPLFMSFRMGVLENIVASASLRRISDYLEHAPKEWMIGNRSSLNINSVFRVGGITVVVALLASFVDLNRQANTISWDTRYNHFGSCSDGIRSGLEQHIDCGGPESSCPQTCREKYGEYILIPGNRDCAQVDGYVHVTTQRACSTAYKTWSRLNNKTMKADHALVFAGVPVGYIWGPLFYGVWQHANWTNGFHCGATSIPGFDLITDREYSMDLYAFPALFSSWNPPHGNQEPLAYLCYAEKSQSCQTLSNRESSVEFEETMACSGVFPREWPASAWRNISSPRPIPSTKWHSGDSVVEFRAGRGSNGDCAEIQLRAAQGIGSQVVFALECDITQYVDMNQTTVGGFASIPCPTDNRVKISVETAAVPRSTVLVYPGANATNFTSYILDAKEQTITVSPGSTLILVVDKSSDLRNVSFCF